MLNRRLFIPLLPSAFYPSFNLYIRENNSSGFRFSLAALSGDISDTTNMIGGFLLFSPLLFGHDYTISTVSYNMIG